MYKRFAGFLAVLGMFLMSVPVHAASWYDISTLDTTPVTTIMTSVLAAGAIIWCCRKGYNALFKS